MDMEVITYLPPPLLDKLRRAVHKTATVGVTSTLSSLVERLSHSPDAVVVVDPRHFKKGDLDRVCRLLDTHQTRSVVTYLSHLDPETAHALVQLSRRRVNHLMIAGHNDASDGIRETVALALGDSLTAELLHMVAPQLAPLPSSARRAIERLFLTSDSIRDIDQLAQAAHVCPRTLHTMLASAGITPSGKLIRLARVWHAYHQLRHGHWLLAPVSQKLGYCSPRALQQNSAESWDNRLLPSRVGRSRRPR